MTIFDYLNSILFSRKKIELNCDDESQFSSFMINRWISFYSKDVAVYVNQTSNQYCGVFISKQEQSDFIFNVYPKLKYKRLEYIKKAKKDDSKEDKHIIPEFMSQREYIHNVELLKTLSK